MKVVFLEDVPKVARAGEIKEVADGYGRNFLIPQKLALLANSSAVSIMEARQKIRAKEVAKLEMEAVELARQLEGKEIFLKAKAGAKDRLYGSITNTDIASEVENSIGLVIDKRKIELDEPIRQLGSYEVVVKLAKDIAPKIKVTVAGEEVKEEVEKEAKNIKETEEAEVIEEAEVTEGETEETEGETKVTDEETG